MTDVANLVLAIDSTSVPKATASLDGLAAAGARAEAATVGLGGGFKSGAAGATAMAAAAQLSARAAVDQAAGFGAATNAARVNTLAMRETLVVARELSRGNFTRLPGSLTLLAQGVGSQGGLGAYGSAIAQQLGLIKQVQNAELAATAAEAANAAASVAAAAQKAGANILATDTEVALAEAQLRVAEGATAEAAAQARLAAAHEAVAAAALQAKIAEDALAVAQGRATEASAASAAATRTVIGGAGVGLIGLGLVAGVTYAAFKRMQDQIKDDGSLDKFAESSRLSAEQIKKLGGEVDYTGHNIRTVTGLTVTFGDVMAGVWAEIKTEASDSGPWDSMKNHAVGAFDIILSAWNKTSAGITAGLWTLQNLSAGGGLIALGVPAGVIPTVNGGETSLSKNYAKAKADNDAAYARIEAGAEAHRLATLQKLSDAHNPPKEKKAPGDHGLREAIDKLQAEIKGQYDLAAAYQVSDAAAQRAVANQKGAEDAIAHKGGLDQFRALELQKLVAEDVAKQAKTNAGLQTELSIRSQLNGQLADGTTTVAQYNAQLKLETTLHGLNVDLENATAEHKGVVRDIIKQTIELETEQLQLEAQLNALKQIAANDNDIARLQLENSLMGVSNKERATAIAQLEAMQQLKEIDPNGLLTNGERNNFVQSAVNKAAAGVQSPFQQWARDIPQTAAAINDALQSIEVRGFDSLASGIADVITGTKSLGAAFRDIANQIIGDIIQMTVKMLIFRAISGLFGGGAPNPSVGNAAVQAAFDAVQPRASGGPVSGGQTYLVGEKGPELFRPSTSGAIVPNNQLAANNNRSGPIEITIGFGDAPDFAPYVQQVSATHAAEAVKISVNHTNNTIKQIVRPKLNG